MLQSIGYPTEVSHKEITKQKAPRDLSNYRITEAPKTAQLVTESE